MGSKPRSGGSLRWTCHRLYHPTGSTRPTAAAAVAFALAQLLTHCHVVISLAFFPSAPASQAAAKAAALVHHAKRAAHHAPPAANPLAANVLVLLAAVVAHVHVHMHRAAAAHAR